MGRKLTQEEFEKKVFDIHGNIYKIVGIYTGQKNKIDVYCTQCNKVISMSPVSLLSGHNCPVCSNQLVIQGKNDLNTTHPEIGKLLENTEEGKLFTYGTNKKLYFICPICGNKILNKPRDLFNNKTGTIRCCGCSDGISFPEKYFAHFLNQLNIEYIYQLTQKDQSWCQKYRYDFYLPKYNCIIEVHGEQHYRNKTTFNNNNCFYRILENDVQKEKLANEHVAYYVVIDAKVSDPNYIMDSIKNSIIPKILNMQDIDWSQIAKLSSSNLTNEICTDWNSGYKDVDILAKKYNLNRSTIYKYLKLGKEIGICDYNHQENLKYQKQKQYEKINLKKQKPIQCVETKEVFPSIKDAQAKFNEKSKNILKALNGTLKTAYGYHWVYVNSGT